MVEDNRLIQERIRKLNELKEMGVNPYPYSYNVTHHAKDIKDKHEGLKAEQKTDDEVSVAGRIVLFRRMGKVCFISLRDQSGDIQIYVARDNVGEEKYNVLKKFDIGDIVGFKGIIFATRTGEITVEAKELIMLSKSVRPLPDKFHGLQEQEITFPILYLLFL
jgi:lysyl-tRNA synthetase class 2